MALLVKGCEFYIRIIENPKTTRTSSDLVEQICIVSEWSVEHSRMSWAYKVSFPILIGPGKN